VSPILSHKKLPNGKGDALNDLLLEELTPKEVGQPPIELFVLVVIND
jgi:hypothetical protein